MISVERSDSLLMYSPLCFPDSPACPYRGISALTVPSYADPWGRHRHCIPATDGGGWTDGKSPTEEEATLPKDPRQWSRDDVARWVLHVTTMHGLPAVHLDRFLMNGKALCLMNMEMFVKRVPLGGKLLYKDFQLRLSSALYS